MSPGGLHLQLKKFFDQGQYNCHQINHCRNNIQPLKQLFFREGTGALFFRVVVANHYVMLYSSYREHSLPVSENLLKQDFFASSPNQKWSGDITYLRTDEGWLYLPVVIDLWSRAVIALSMSPRMTAQLACDALQMALWRRKRPENVIVHTDRGGQYCSADYQALLKRHNLRGSMSAKGCCYDNACVESFFYSLRMECIHGERFASREIMRTTVFNYIECDYNLWRRHSACGDATDCNHIRYN